MAKRTLRLVIVVLKETITQQSVLLRDLRDFYKEVCLTMRTCVDSTVAISASLKFRASVPSGLLPTGTLGRDSPMRVGIRSYSFAREEKNRTLLSCSAGVLRR